VHGISEALPLADNSADAIVCTLTLCSVVDPARSVAEIKRVLKPGGKFLFWEHVLSQTDPTLAQRQIELTPNQVKRADGCHLDRKTGDVIRAAGFQKLDLEYIELKEFSFLNPTVCGIATA
jgi:ubiquinone/menaquinone biosynthesis C-methylase UbiE